MRISLIIPSFNRAGLVGATLESVVAQTRPADEVLVVDDGSTDDTRAVVARFGAPVRYHYQENAGLTAARAAGLARTSGDAVLMLDSDDLLRPEALARLEAALEGDPAAALAYCRGETIDGAGRPTPPPWTLRDAEGMVWEQLMEGNFLMSAGAVLVRRAHLDRIGDADIPPAVADWGMWLRLAECAPFVRVPEPLFQYRIHGAAMSRNVAGMYWDTYRLRRFFLRRFRRDPARRRLVMLALGRARRGDAEHLVTLAYEDRRRGDAGAAGRKLAVALRLRPGYWMNFGVLRFALGTWRAARHHA